MIETTLSLLCRVGGHMAAVPLADVVEIMRPLPVQGVADVPAFVLGLAVVRGVPVPVLDLACLVAQSASASSKRFVCVRTGDVESRVVALAVEDVLGVRAFTPGELSGLPPLLRGGSDVLTALGTLDRELLVVLSTGNLIPEEAWSALCAEATP